MSEDILNIFLLYTGTMLDLPYNQFTGTIQVMKAVGNHLVLTFCETLPKSQFFTIVLTKKPHNLSRDVRNCDDANIFLIWILTLPFLFSPKGHSIYSRTSQTSRFECTISEKSLQEFVNFLETTGPSFTTCSRDFCIFDSNYQNKLSEIRSVLWFNFST